LRFFSRPTVPTELIPNVMPKSGGLRR
jgi:hypothetical protein